MPTWMEVLRQVMTGKLLFSVILSAVEGPLRTCGVNHASRRTSKRSMAIQIQASALATVFS
jgi:hypothetical protein